MPATSSQATAEILNAENLAAPRVEVSIYLRDDAADHIRAVDVGSIHGGVGDELDPIVIRVGAIASGQVTILGSLDQAKRFAAELATQLGRIEAARVATAPATAEPVAQLPPLGLRVGGRLRAQRGQIRSSNSPARAAATNAASSARVNVR